MSTIARRLEDLNRLREANGKQPLKAWKSSAAKLEDAIGVEKAPLKLADDADLEQAIFERGLGGESDEVDADERADLADRLLLGWQASEDGRRWRLLEWLRDQVTRAEAADAEADAYARAAVDEAEAADLERGHLEATALALVDEASDGSEAPTPEAPRPEALTKGKAARGDIGRMVIDLLVGSTMAYGELVLAVRGRFPEARTTARSVASVAADLRRDGAKVPSRRAKKA